MKRLLALSSSQSRALPDELSLWVDGANGDDLNDCTELHPCKEIQGAVSERGVLSQRKVAAGRPPPPIKKLGRRGYVLHPPCGRFRLTSTWR
jgi:hypothetical protein